MSRTSELSLVAPSSRGVTLLTLTAVFRKVPEGYVAFVEELPGANTQGETLPEARANLREVVELLVSARRAEVRRDLPGTDVIRETLDFIA